MLACTPHRETQDPSLLSLASRQIWQVFPRYMDFEPRALFIATWDEVGYYDKGYEQVTRLALQARDKTQPSYA